MKKLAFIAFALFSLVSLTAQADGPPLLAVQRPGLLGSYIFQPMPVGTQTWSKSDAAPGVLQSAQTTDIAVNNFKITPQGQYPSAVTNVVGGSLELDITTPNAVSTPEAGFIIKRGAVVEAFLGPYGAAPTTFGEMFLIPGVTQTATNYTVVASSTTTDLNAPTTTNIQAGGNTIAAATSTGLAITGLETVSTTLGVTGASTLQGAIVHGSPQTIACATGGTQTVATSPTSGIIVTSGTLASNCTIDFGTNATSGEFTLDMSGVTLGTSFGVIFKNGTSSSATFLSGSVITTGDTMAHVWTHGANTLAVTY